MAVSLIAPRSDPLADGGCVGKTVQHEDEEDEEFVQHVQKKLDVAVAVLGKSVGLIKAKQLRAVRDKGTWKYPEFSGTFDIYGKHIGADGAKALAALLSPRQDWRQQWVFNDQLRVLSFGGNDIGLEGATDIADALAPRQQPSGEWVFNPYLRTLKAEENNLGSKGCAVLSRVAFSPRQNPDGEWVFNHFLSTIDLWANQIGPAGGKALAEALAPRKDSEGVWVHGDGLAKLVLNSNKLGVEGATKVSDALAPHTNPDGSQSINHAIRAFDIRENVVEASGRAALRRATWRINDRRDCDLAEKVKILV